MADINGLFSKASAGQRAIATYLTAQKPIGADRISAFDLSTWDNSGPVHFSLYALDANGVRDASTQTDWKGIVSGSTIINIQLRAGTDTVYPVNSPVVATVTAGWANDLIQGITTSLDPDGTLKAGAVDNSDAIANGVVTGAKLAAGSVNSSHIVDGSITTTDFNYSTVPWAVAYFASLAGQVYSSQQANAISFDSIETNGHAGITLTDPATVYTALRVTDAGIYLATGMATCIDVPGPNQVVQLVAAPDGSNYNLLTPYGPPPSGSYNGRGDRAVAPVYLQAGGRVRLNFYNGANSSTRIGGANASEKFATSLSLVRVG